MQIGIFTKTFERPTLEACLDAVRQYELEAVQLNLESAGGEPMPDEISDELCERIRTGLADRGIALTAVSGTFNIIHPDPREQSAGMRRLEVLASACAGMGASLITMSTGTRDPDYMWRRHADNDTPAAWRDMLEAMGQAVRIAEDNDVTLVFEPEVSNVVDSAQKARRLLDEMGSDHLKVVLDGANLFHEGELPRMREILDEAFDLLGEDIRMAHGKDLERDGEAGFLAAGTGVLDYDHYLALLQGIGFAGGLILHSLEEGQVEESLSFVRGRLAP